MRTSLIALLILSACVLMASKVEDRSSVILERKPTQEQNDKPEKGDKPTQDEEPKEPKEPEKEEAPEKEVIINADLEVTGYAQKTVSANLIKIGLEFSSIACSVSEALAENSEKVRNAIKAIKSEGCKDEMITTVYFAITPKPREEKEKDMKDDGDKNKQMQQQHDVKHVEFDYIVTQTIEVTVSSKKQAVKIIDCSVSNGAVLLWVNWDISDKTEKMVKAFLIREAIDDAVFKAKKVAKRLGFRLESVKKVKLNDGNPWVYANFKVAAGTELVGINKTVSLNVEIVFNMVKVQKEKKH